ncbi:GH35 family beta-galactosidase [Novosphingobium sp. YAF33]|uniref:GH35 family beta-galactosidase n=1 Tax=Novosphingobium sp. YAF33 TaxID=3233082 RepID=UPI003F999806
MRDTLCRLALSATAILAVIPAASAQQLPVIRDNQLLVDGKPYLALGGELHNSSASSPEYMQPIWDKLQAMHVRTVVGTVSWEDFEPKEGQFDFRAVDAQIAEARKRDMRLVLIWFGAFKNAASTYAPSWLRSNERRFPRAIAQGTMSEAFTYKGAMPKPVLSVFSPELLKADRTAFVALMRHLAEVDTDHRVIMVQVNNETGMLRDSRDRSALAERAWKAPVPPQLLQYLAAHRSGLKPELDAVWSRQGRRASGTWSDVFGTDWQAEEVFMAWHFASYMEALAAAGKRELALPMYANGWLGPQDGQPLAGQYPSGGPAKRVLDVWRAAAPSLDMLSPDIYAPNTKEVLADYDHASNPLFVPEAQFRTGDIFWALGQHRTIGYSVFGIEDGRTDGQLAQAYAELFGMDQAITKAQAEGRIAGVLLDDGKPVVIKLGGYSITVQETMALLKQMLLDVGLQAPPPPPPLPSETEGPGTRPAPGDGRAFGLIIDEGHDTFLVVGKGFTADFAIGSKLAEVDRVEEGRFDTQGWKVGRVLNGDERLSIVPTDRIGAIRIKLMRPRSN